MLAATALSGQRSDLGAHRACAQGSLTPPGAPAPTMKTLDQIEARTPISSALFTITSSGSYYLTGNLSVSSGDPITINANGVTLDLNGFTISSTANPAVGMGIHLTRPNSDITILNGNIRGGVTYTAPSFSTGPSFQDSIYFTGGGPVNQLQNIASLSTIAPGFQGYLEVVCDFPFAHGFGLFSNVGLRTVAATIPALVVPAQAAFPFRPNGVSESLGQ